MDFVSEWSYRAILITERCIDEVAFVYEELMGAPCHSDRASSDNNGEEHHNTNDRSDEQQQQQQQNQQQRDVSNERRRRRRRSNKTRMSSSFKNHRSSSSSEDENIPPGSRRSSRRSEHREKRRRRTRSKALDVHRATIKSLKRHIIGQVLDYCLDANNPQHEPASQTILRMENEEEGTDEQQHRAGNSDLDVVMASAAQDDPRTTDNDLTSSRSRTAATRAKLRKPSFDVGYDSDTRLHILQRTRRYQQDHPFATLSSHRRRRSTPPQEEEGESLSSMIDSFSFTVATFLLSSQHSSCSSSYELPESLSSMIDPSTTDTVLLSSNHSSYELPAAAGGSLSMVDSVD